MQITNMCKIKNYDVGNLFLHISIFLICLVPIIISFFLVTNGNYTAIRFQNSLFEIGLPCSFKDLTGYNCPSCGMTRCFVYMTKLNLNLAWNMSKPGVLLYILCLFQIPYRLFLIVGGNLENQKYIKVFQTLFLILIGFVILLEFVVQFL
ncbi:UNVERIFIED_CONTAM: uncharacterized protein DUF2752 [Acetivibrio alkalicellulosi]